MTPDPTRCRSRRRWSTARAAGLVVALALLLLPARAPAQATPEGCGYGTGGPNASTLCWLDMSGYDDARARAPGGQPMTVRLPGGYTISFTVTASGGRSVASRPLPTNGTASYIGTMAYVGTPGRPALLTGTGTAARPTATTTLTLKQIEVRDAAGQPVTGYAFVGADAENTGINERITWTADKPIYEIARLSPSDGANGCQNNVTREHERTISCTGNSEPPGGAYGTVIVAANAPTEFSQSLYTGFRGSREAVAFAIMTSKIQITKSVVGRVRGSDSFDVSARSPEGSTIQSASTGSGSSATTGELTVLPRTNGSSYTLAEAVTPGSGTRLADYAQSWSCTRNGAADPSLPSGAGTAKAVSPGPGDDIECMVTNTQLPADLSIEKTAAPSPAVPGTEQTFSLVVTNDGPSQATNVVVTDDLPDELTFVSAGSGCSEAGGTVTCTIGSLPAGASQTFTIAGTVASSLDHCLANTATVSSSTPDSDADDNTSTVCVPIRGEVDLSITKTPSTTGLPVGGGQVMYTLVVENDGPSDATGVTVTDPMATGVAVVAADASQGSCATTGGTVSCSLGTLVPGGSAQVLVTAQAASTPGARTNTAHVSGDQQETDPGDNEASATVTVAAPPPASQPPARPPARPPAQPSFDLEVGKRASRARALVGQPVRYTIVVTNRGSAAAPHATVTDTLSAPATVARVRTTAGSCRRRLPMRCALGPIAAGASVTIRMVVKHRTAGGRQRNAASATGAGRDADEASNLATVDVKIRRVALRVSKTADRSTVRAGGSVRYRISVRNPTRGEARNVRVCDRLSSGMRFIASTPRASRRGGQRCWTIRRLGARKSRTYRVRVRVAAGANGRTVNRATTSSRDTRPGRARRAVRVLGVATPVTG